MTRLILALAMLGAMTTANAQFLFEEGKHYLPLRAEQPTPDADSVEVLEFFSYGCSHCYEFEEHLTPWVAELDEDVAFRRVPAGLGRAAFQRLAAVYHIADELDILDEVHRALFEEIHVERNQQLLTPDGLKAFFAEHGVSEAEFVEAFNSEGVRERFTASEAAAPNYDLMGVPTIIVDGKYRVVRSEHVRSYEEMLEVVDYLIEMERDADS